LLDLLGFGPREAPTHLRLLVAVGCGVLAAVFLRAGWPKAADPEAFAIMVFRYEFLPDNLVNLTAIIMPWLEIVCAVALLAVPRLRQASAWLIALMLLAFTGLIGSALARGITDISCGCFSVDPSGSHIGVWNIYRNLALLAVTGLVIWGTKPRKSQS
jgi:uncharacterized membrane protein YphA (DoxX/SURF4 family)